MGVEIVAEEGIVWMGETKYGGFLWKYLELVTKSYSRGQLGVWRGKCKTVYTIKDTYCKVGQDFGHQIEVFQKIWQVKALPASLFCAWRVMLNRLSTRDNLIRIGIQVKSKMCALYNLVEENVCLLLFLSTRYLGLFRRCAKIG